ncbi:hypothetical protein [Nocardia bovistercoris]|uniref:DUF4333 domain-containing protein n=1 Tax=Nocardia bovistercoris TaxID=2785916 RepID=A0A931N2U1_9NOCA|nr:hypothetical protein [Nocardia bovistercoris]MBH0776421.1 hypothetical protein [Nocardia bovistercoris]
MLARTRLAAALTGSAAALVCTAGPAAAADTVDIIGATLTAVAAAYTCDAAAGAVAIKAMAGDPSADHAAALGVGDPITCDGTEKTATITLTAAPGEAPLAAGALVQIRVALVDRADIVVAGQAKVFPLQG